MCEIKLTPMWTMAIGGTMLLAPPALPPLPAQDAPPAAAPAHFSQIVGRVNISASAAPRVLGVNDSIELTISIAGVTSDSYGPRRKFLHSFNEQLSRGFYIEDLPERDRLTPERGVWEFVYRLRPRSPLVSEIPSVRLIYYEPKRRKFQTAFTEPIAITVRLDATSSQKEILKALPTPERFQKTFTPDELSRDDRPFRVGFGLALTLFAVPPLGCIATVLMWRRCHPAPAARAQRRRSGAAQKGLAELANHPGDIVRAADAFCEYLRRRFDVSTAELTPAEVDRHLARFGFRKGTRRACIELLRRGDEARYAPITTTPASRPGSVEPAAAEFAAAAARLIHDLEADSCVA